MAPPTDEFLDQTIRFWQPRYPNRKLTREDARQINENLAGFFGLLIKWDREDKHVKAGSIGVAAPKQEPPPAPQ